MRLFSEPEMETIRRELTGREGNVVITFRNSHGPTRLKKLWTEMLTELAHSGKCLSWWSSSGTVGLLECRSDKNLDIYGQWALADETKLTGVFGVADDELVNIREGFDAGNVTSSVMRVIRIGETGQD
jgi:limonene-1,2-epoxide hydrolase